MNDENGTLSPEYYRAQQRRLYVFWCRLYCVLGIVSIGSGVMLITLVPAVTGAHADPGMKLIAAIFIVFGVVRIANSMVVLRRLKARMKA